VIPQAACATCGRNYRLIELAEDRVHTAENGPEMERATRALRDARLSQSNHYRVSHGETPQEGTRQRYRGSV
jgi:hypothetical protein